MTSAPRARWRKRGVPPTAAHARTGLFTPPGITRHASAKSRSESCATSRNPDTRPAQGQAEKNVTADEIPLAARPAHRLYDQPSSPHVRSERIHRAARAPAAVLL